MYLLRSEGMPASQIAIQSFSEEKYFMHQLLLKEKHTVMKNSHKMTIISKDILHI